MILVQVTRKNSHILDTVFHRIIQEIIPEAIARVFRDKKISSADVAIRAGDIGVFDAVRSDLEVFIYYPYDSLHCGAKDEKQKMIATAIQNSINPPKTKQPINVSVAVEILCQTHS